MPRVILHTGHALDHQCDARQGPETGTEAMRAGALAQCRVDAGQLFRSQSRLTPRSASGAQRLATATAPRLIPPHDALDRKSTRLNSSHTVISYAVFCLKKKKK